MLRGVGHGLSSPSIASVEEQEEQEQEQEEQINVCSGLKKSPLEFALYKYIQCPLLEIIHEIFLCLSIFNDSWLRGET